MQLKLTDICAMCCGELAANSDLQLEINHIVIDSRDVGLHTLFVAIKGDNNDGHNYVADLLNSPGIAAIVSKDFTLKLPNLIYVEDTTLALGKLASCYRQKFKIPVVAITGSNGKTTVKEMLKSICQVKYGDEAVLATSGNLNNHWGVPLTILGLEEQHKVAIIEMGMNHHGELNYLSNLVKPDIAVVNNVALAHVGNFKNKEGIAEAKGEIYDGLGDDGVFCVNYAIPEHVMWLPKFAHKKTVNYGTALTGNYIKDRDSVLNKFILVTFRGEITIELQVLGHHNQDNALTAALLALQLGFDLDIIKLGLENYNGYKGRLERKKAFNGALIIDDSYNANPDSVKAAINAIKVLPQPHWFIFGDLKELGSLEQNLHAEIGEYANDNGIDVLLTYGELANIAGQTFGKTTLKFETHDDLVKYCLCNLPAQATLLVKGSHSMHLDRVVKELTNPA